MKSTSYLRQPPHTPRTGRKSRPGEDFLVAERTSERENVASFVLQVRSAFSQDDELLTKLSRLLEESGFDATLIPASNAILDESAMGATAAEDELRANEEAMRRAELRGEARLVGWTQDGTLVEGSKVEKAWGVKRQTVDAARQRGEIFSLWVKGKHWYSREALKLERKALAAITLALDDINPASKLLFLLRRHGALRGRTPADAVAEGRLDDVLRLAGTWARS